MPTPGSSPAHLFTVTCNGWKLCAEPWQKQTFFRPLSLNCMFRTSRFLGKRVTDEVFWRKDGTRFPVEYVFTPLLDDGEVVGAVVSFRNVTDQAKAKNPCLKARGATGKLLDRSMRPFFRRMSKRRNPGCQRRSLPHAGLFI